MLWLRNDVLQLGFLPEFGGKIASLRSARTGEEFLLPPLGDYKQVSPSANFSENDGGGFDECLPSVAACESIAGEDPVPDHGDLWRQAWHVDFEGDSVVLHADSASRPLRLTRRASLHGSSLVLDYEIRNLSDASTSWLWSAHPLFRIDAGDRIVLPNDVERVTVEYSADRVFDRNTSLAWPNAESTSGVAVDLSEVGVKDGVTAHKLFAEMDQAGWGALYRGRINQGVVVRFDPSSLPFLGIWICSGAWPEEREAKQYTVALEPTTSNVDSLASAALNGTARQLEAEGVCNWTMEIELLGGISPVTFEHFCASAASTPSNP
ncbi:MAG TPA: hypothetical protein VGM27_21880 [Acidobacteriaceae bacterium]